MSALDEHAAAPSEAPRIRPTFGFLAILVLVTGLGPFGMSSFIPSIPDIQESLDVPIATAQLTLSLSMIALAVSTLIYGPLSDHYGRRPVLLGAVALAVVGSLIGALATGIEMAIVGRVLQAMGGSAGIVLTRAIVQDVFPRERVASILGYVTAAMVVAPLVGPTIGGLVADTVGWRGNFAMVAGVAAIVWVAVLFRLPETLRARRGVLSLGAITGDFGTLVACRAYMRYVAFGTLSQAAFFAFLAGGPFIVTQVYGRPAWEYGLYSAIMPLGFMLGSLMVGAHGVRFGNVRLILFGAGLAIVGTVLAALAPTLAAPLIDDLAAASGGMAGSVMSFAIFAPLFVTALGNGFSMPATQAGSVTAAPEMAGAASGLFGFIQMIFASAVAQFIGYVQGAVSPMPTLTVMLVLTLLAPIAFAVLGERREAAPSP